MGVYIYIYIYYPPYIILYPHQLDIWSLGPPKLDQKTRPVQEGKGDMLAYYEALKEGIRWRPHPDRRGADRKQSQARKELGDPATATGCCCYRMVMFSNQLKCYVYIYLYHIYIYISIYSIHKHIYMHTYLQGI